MKVIVSWTHRVEPVDGHKAKPNIHGIRGKYQNCMICAQPLDRQDVRPNEQELERLVQDAQRSRDEAARLLARKTPLS
jgi:hypothetical protein